MGLGLVSLAQSSVVQGCGQAPEWALRRSGLSHFAALHPEQGLEPGQLNHIAQNCRGDMSYVQKVNI